LSWGASSGALSYAYCIDTINDNACNASWISNGTTRIKALSGLTPGTIYYWQASATNTTGTTYADGGITAWWSFVVPSIPGAFGKSSPTNGATNQLSNPTLSWGSSSNVVNYQFCIDTSNNNTCNASWINTGTTASVALTGLTPATYYWQVQSTNAVGSTYADGSATSWWSFTVDQAPGAFNKTSPVSGITNLPTAITLTWGASARAVSYQYCVNTTAACTTPAAWASTGALTTVTLTGLIPGTYYWQVQAVNGAGSVDANAGAWWSFTIKVFDSIGVYNNSIFYLRNSNTNGVADLMFSYGWVSAGIIPLAGDWDGNGSTTIGIYNNGVFYLRNTNNNGIADLTFAYGPVTAGVIPLAGDWDGNGTDTIGVYYNGVFYLRNSNDNGIADLTFSYGPLEAGVIPMAGDWDGNGTDTVGVYRNSIFYLRNSNNNGIADLTFSYGWVSAGIIPLAGDWDGNGITTIGIYNNGIFYLRNSNNNGIADLTFAYGPVTGSKPLAGKW
jgi:hypothetical protein